jgi:luciferase family oxidoreductase group 1
LIAIEPKPSSAVDRAAGKLDGGEQLRRVAKVNAMPVPATTTKTEGAEDSRRAIPLSILDLAAVGRHESIAESFAGSVEMARAAERAGYRRVWYAEHHNISSIASSATAVLIAHIASQTETIRLGSGGVMLPNHSPMVIAEQFGTLATLHPGRIDLGLGRAPGSDQATTYALRRDPGAAESFPRDVVELQGLLGDESPIPGVKAIPGKGTHVPLYMLGSSLFGAQLAAELGLPYAFASHFAPRALHEAIGIYGETFKPSEQLGEPYVIAAVGAIVAETEEDASEQLESARRLRARALFSRGGRKLEEDDIDAILSSPQGSVVDEMLTYNAVGTPDQAGAYLEKFRDDTAAQELMVVHQSNSVANRLRSVELLAEAVDPTGG